MTGYCQNPCPIPDFASTLNVANATTRVTSVIGANVSLTFTIDYTNGSTTTASYSGDLSTGLGNLPDGAAPIAANLNPGDPIFNSAYAPIINATIQKPYAGALRQANVWNNTHNLVGGSSGYSAIYFDKSTGIVLENQLVLQTASISDRVTGTNLWTPDQPPTVTITSLTPNTDSPSLTASVNFSVIDPDSAISSISVNWGDGSAPDMLAGSATSDTHSYAKSGTFQITITATDNKGYTGHVSSQWLTVSLPLPAPAAHASTIFGLASVSFYGIVGVIVGVMAAATLLIVRQTRKTASPNLSP